MNRRTIQIGVAMVFSVLAVTQGLAQKERRTQPFMRQKLVYAQAILEGITLEKFDLVVTNATRLRDMSQTNAFLILRNPEYLRCITNFQTNVDALMAAAKNEQGDRAFEAYVKMSESCIACHRYFRREQFRRFETAK